MAEWISVKDRLPEPGDGYASVIWTDGRVAESGYYQSRYGWSGWMSSGVNVSDRVTHWMPLPAPPAPCKPR